MQACVSEGIATLEKATHLANQLSLFSSNEAVEEVSTVDLKWVWNIFMHINTSE